MVFLVSLLIILSCYVSVAEMSEECKTMYFVTVGVISTILIVFNVVF